MEGASLPLNQKSTVLGLNSAALKEQILSVGMCLEQGTSHEISGGHFAGNRD